MSEIFSRVHFLRPEWLWMLLLLLPLVAVWMLRARRRNAWRTAVDPHLLSHLLVGKDRRTLVGLWLLMLGFVLAVAALSGPSWRKQEQPLWQPHTPLVVALDLSHSITATDLQPSRLLQARAKLDVLLRERKGGDVALLVYAGDAFTVAPLTADAANLRLFLDELRPEIMPVPGQRADRAIAAAVDLLLQSKAKQGDILLLTGQADAAALAAARQAFGKGYRVSVLGLGTTTGAAYRDVTGMVARTFLDEASLRGLSAAGGGNYRMLSVDTADLQALCVLSPGQGSGQQPTANASASWQDEGYWLLLPLMVLALLAFRRRTALMVLALLCVSPWSLPVHAAEQGGMWRRQDQLQHQRLSDGVQAYRAKDYARAQLQFEGIDSDEGWYNLGNALARQGRYDAAINAYDRALKHQPGMPDALANKAAVEAARKRQPPPSGSDDTSSGQQSPQDQQDADPQGKNPAGDESGDPGGSGKAPPASPESRKSSTEPPQAGDKPGKDSEGPAPEDAQGQQQADQAQREQMAKAMQQGAQGKDESAQAQPARTAEDRERQQAVEAWMQRVPDAPGSILKAKFQLEYERRRREGR